MNDTAVRTTVPDVEVARKLSASARRRRMARRRAEKKFSYSAALIGGLYILASVVAPGHIKHVSAAPAPIAELPSALQWHAAGEVMRRIPDATSARARFPWSVQAEQSAPRASLQRWHRIFGYTTRYAISTDLAASIYDNAVAQAIEPELGFRLVNVESEFKTRASSSVGAVGLTQLMLSTARDFEPNVTREELMDPNTNLRIGFKYLRALIRENKGNLSLALLVYNRGPAAVQLALSQGLNPTNGYERIVTRGYRGRERWTDTSSAA